MHDNETLEWIGIHGWNAILAFSLYSTRDLCLLINMTLHPVWRMYVTPW